MSFLTTLRELIRPAETESCRATDIPLSDPGPPCKNGGWCRCVDWAIQREQWVRARDLAESDEVRDLATGMVEDLDELLKGHKPNSSPAGDGHKGRIDMSE